MIVLLLLLYLLPTIVAVCRSHPSAMSIFVVNAFLGWTFIGWVVTLAWAAAAIRPRIGS